MTISLLTVICIALLAANFFQYKKNKKKSADLNDSLHRAWAKERTLVRDFLLHVTPPEKIRYLTKEEAESFYEFTHSIAQDDPGPGDGLYIIDPSKEEVERIKQFSRVVGSIVTWPLHKAPFYVIPGGVTEEEKVLYSR